MPTTKPKNGDGGNRTRGRFPPTETVIAGPRELAAALADPALEELVPGPARRLLDRIAAESGRYGARYELVVRETGDE